MSDSKTVTRFRAYIDLGIDVRVSVLRQHPGDEWTIARARLDELCDKFSYINSAEDFAAFINYIDSQEDLDWSHLGEPSVDAQTIEEIE